MEHKEGAISTLGQGEVVLGTQKGMAETGVSLEYFDRYERSRGYESMGASNVDYWLSEDEEEDSQQLKRQNRKSRNKREPYVVQEAKAPKLRPAEDILKRMRWDSGLDMENFTIGYLERFEGIKEMPMSKWIRETSDEDFIPQHRIKYFKRSTDGEVVWDREGRIDKIFGSGLTGQVAGKSGSESWGKELSQQTTVLRGEVADTERKRA